MCLSYQVKYSHTRNKMHTYSSPGIGVSKSCVVYRDKKLFAVFP